MRLDDDLNANRVHFVRSIIIFQISYPCRRLNNIHGPHNRHTFNIYNAKQYTMRQTCDFEGADKRIACLLRTGRSRGLPGGFLLGRRRFRPTTVVANYTEFYSIRPTVIPTADIVADNASFTVVGLSPKKPGRRII